MIPVWIESDNGHDELNVPEEKLEQEVEKQVKEGNWATVEKTDGSSTILTQKDVKDETGGSSKSKDWTSLFAPMRSSEGSPKLPELNPESKVASNMPNKSRVDSNAIKSVTVTRKAVGG